LKSNSNNAFKWNIEKGYEGSPDKDNEPPIYPYHVLGSGAKAGLFVLLRLYKQNYDYICHGPVQGFKVLLHQAGEMPQVRD